MAEPITPKPWYKYWLLWAAMVPPAAAVIGGLVSAWLAGGPPDLVVDDYGEIALATQQRMERDQQARALGLSARLVVIPEGNGDNEQPALIRVQLVADREPLPEPGSLILRVIHPTTADKDRVLELRRAGDGYEGRLDWPATRYYLELADPASRWRLRGESRAGALQLQLQPVSRPGAGK